MLLSLSTSLNNVMKLKAYEELNPPNVLLLGGGPSNIDPRVMAVLSSPIVGHLDPYFLEIMDDTIELLRYTFKTNNNITLPISGTGSAGMQTAISNIVEGGDEVVVLVNGYFGERIKDMVYRCGGKPIVIAADWGKTIKKEAFEEVLENSNAQVVALVHTETSTGVLQPLRDIVRIAHLHDSLLIVDAVTSLGGCELDVDALGIDVCFSASQKCLSCPPGLAPITVSERAMAKIRNRKTKVQSWYFDLSLIEEYWVNRNRVYHHTAPISLIYAIRESLRFLYGEGLEKRWLTHKRNSLALIRGVEALGLKMNAEEGYRAPSINAISIPDEINDENIRKSLRENFNISISAGLGVLKGKIWRVGLMGVNSSERNVLLFLEAFERVLNKEGYPSKPNQGVSAAMDVFKSF